MKISTFFEALFAIFLVCTINMIAGETSKKGDYTAYNKRTNALYLEETAKKAGVFKMRSGLLIEVIHLSNKPDAKSPNEKDPCDVTYVGTFRTGKYFHN